MGDSFKGPGKVLGTGAISRIEGRDEALAVFVEQGAEGLAEIRLAAEQEVDVGE